MPASPSLRAFSPRARRPGRAGVGRRQQRPEQRQAAHQLRRRDGEMERHDRAHRMGDHMRALDTQGGADPQHRLHEARRSSAGPRPGAERPEPGRSGRTRAMARQAPAAAASTRSTCRPGRGSSARRRPSPSISTAMRSTNCVAMARNLLDGVLERTDAVDLDAHAIAAAQVFRRVEADADARRRAGGDDVAGIERDAGRDGRDQGRDVEDQVARSARPGAARR